MNYAERFNLKMLNEVLVKKQIKISKRFASLENLDGPASTEL
jgi:hypothetical protein